MDEYMSDEAARSNPSTARKVTDSLEPGPSIVPGATEWRPDWSRDDLLRRDRIVSQHSAQIRRGLGRHRTEGVFRLGDLFRRWTGKRVDNRERNRLTGKSVDRIIIDDPWSDDVSPEARAAARRLFLGEPADRVEATMTFTPVEEGQDFKPEGTFMVGGLVDRDLVERYESLRESYDTVVEERNRLVGEYQDEIADLRKLIRDATPAVRLVMFLAANDGALADKLPQREICQQARDALQGQGYVPTYSDESRKRAAEAVAKVEPFLREGEAAKIVDDVARALGMRRAGA